MIQKLLAFTLVLIFSYSATSQLQWTELSPESTAAAIEGDLQAQYLTEYKAYSIDYSGFYESQSALGITEIELPSPSGEITKYSLSPSKVMAEELAKRHSEIKTYYGKDNNSGTQISLTVSPHGLSAVYLSNKGRYTLETDSYFVPDTYKFYRISSLKSEMLPKICGLEHSNEDKSEDVRANIRSAAERSLHTYTLLMTATSEYTNHPHHGGDKEVVFTTIVNLVNAVNLTQGREVGVNYILANEVDDLIFSDPESDPYEGLNPGEILGSNTGILYDYVSQDAFDIGHVLSARCSGGAAGISRFEIPCNTGKKGGGITCYYNSGPGYLYDVTVHEFGHHLGAGHTWSNCPGNEGQLSSGNAYEIGSGYTIMSYNGLCGGQNTNLQDPDYYHVESLDQMEFFHRVGSGKNCGDFAEEINNQPEVEIKMPENLTIPMQTPFLLEGSASDPDGDEVLMNWEQYDLGPTADIGSPRGSSPAYIGQDPGPDSTRMVPELRYVVSPFLSNPLEPYIDYSREVTFRFTARDEKHVYDSNLPGTNNWKEYEFNITDESGPFTVDSFSAGTEWEVGQEVEVYWSVNNTDKAPVNCKRVNVYFSTTRGRTFPYTIATQTANNGSLKFLVPNLPTKTGRMMVKGDNNIFFNINTSNIEIKEPQEPGFLATVSPYYSEICAPDQLQVDIATSSYLGFDQNISISGDEIPSEAEFEFSKTEISAGDTFSISLDFSNYPAEGLYTSRITMTSDSGKTISLPFEYEIISNDFSDLSLNSPVNGQIAVERVPNLEWTDAEDANSYILEISDNLEFENPVITRSSSNNSITLDEQLERNSIYFWRVIAVNECDTHYVDDVNYFQTLTQNCQVYKADNLPKFINASGRPEITSGVNVPQGGTIIDANISKIKGKHQYISDLVATLISPVGTEAIMFQNACGNRSDFNLSLDDQAPGAINCPINQGKTYIPEEPLSVFNGEDAAGNWRIRLKDQVSGSGGTFEEWSLELCFTSDQPVNPTADNNILYVANGDIQTLQYAIQPSHPTIGSRDLNVAIFTNPKKGTLYHLGEPYDLGNPVPYDDMINYDFYYQHDGSDNQPDSLMYGVISPDGGFYGIEKLDIEIDDIKSSANDPALNKIQLKAWPNPANSQLNISIAESNPAGNMTLTAVNGTEHIRLSSGEINGQNRVTMNISDVPSGVYVLRYTSETATASKKIVVAK